MECCAFFFKEAKIAGVAAIDSQGAGVKREPLEIPQVRPQLCQPSASLSPAEAPEAGRCSERLEGKRQVGCRQCASCSAGSALVEQVPSPSDTRGNERRARGSLPSITLNDRTGAHICETA